jgi:SRSO17 transposase
VKNFNHHFKSYRHDVSDKARQYACGLMQAGSRKNMDRMEEVVPEAISRNLQQFLTHSKWNARDVIEQVACEVDELLGNCRTAGLLIDESAFAKQGNESVGVARQWLGRLGKVDNGQVAVFGVLAHDRFAAAVDARLYLPRKWTDDPARCEKAGIPQAERVFRTKEQLAVEIIKDAISKGLRFGWVGADAGYGKTPAFGLAVDRLGQQFVVDVHSDLRVYLQDPQPYIPQRTAVRGPKPTQYRTDAEAVEVKDIVERFSLCTQPILSVRQTTRGPCKVRVLRVPVYVWDCQSDSVVKWFLIATQTLAPTLEIKISLTNAPESTGLATLAWMQLQRYWVERAFEDAKSECGMADYQVRKWSAWHHHMALVMMSTLFMLTERVRHQDSFPLLSCSDIEELLSRFLPRRDVTQEEVLRQLQHRHRKRQAAIDSHTRVAKKKSAPPTG